VRIKKSLFGCSAPALGKSMPVIWWAITPKPEIMAGDAMLNLGDG